MLIFIIYQLTLQQREAKKQERADAIDFERTSKAGGLSNTTPATPYGNAGTKKVVCVCRYYMLFLFMCA